MLAPTRCGTEQVEQSSQMANSSAEGRFLPSTVCARIAKELFEHNGNAAVLLVRATTLLGGTVYPLNKVHLTTAGECIHFKDAVDTACFLNKIENT